MKELFYVVSGQNALYTVRYLRIMGLN